MNTLKECLDTAIKYLFIFMITMGPGIQQAHARFMVEPQYTNFQGTFKVNGISDSYTGDGTALNLGYIGPYFLAGLELQFGTTIFNQAPTTDGGKIYKSGGVGTYLGFHFFNRWKVWTGYTNSNIEPKSNNDVRYFGQQVNLGIGYRIYEGLMLNYIHQTNYFTQREDDITGKTGSLDNIIKTQGYSFNFSVIFIF
jgi:hypothetical protein